MKDVRAYEGTKLAELISDTRSELRNLKLRASAQDLKGVRAIRSARQTLARLLTRARELKASAR